MKILNYTNYFYIAVIAIFSAFFAVNAVVFALYSPKPIVAKQKQIQESNTLTAEAMLAEVTKRNLLGIEVNAAKPISSAEGGNEGGVARSTSFNGKLTGILLGEKLEDSKAIILVGQDIYVVNSLKEQDGYLLKNASKNSALIAHYGKDYELTLDDGSTYKPAVSGKTSTAGTTKANVTSSDGGTDQITIERSRLVSELSDLNNLMKNILISPMYVEGEFVGYRIARMTEESPLNLLGLQRGDIINRIDGEDLTNPEVLFTKLGQIETVNAVSVDITRGDTKKTLFVEIQ